MTAARALWKGRGRAFDRPRLSPATNPSERAVGQPLTPFAGAPSSGGVDLYCPLRLMFGNLKARWRQARGAQLKRQFENATRSLRRAGRALRPRAESSVQRLGEKIRSGQGLRCADPKVRRQANEADARRRYEHDIGASYALEFLSYHIEASYLPGEDATFVYDLTSRTISEWGDAPRDEGAR
jgi:hypothetical protein